MKLEYIWFDKTRMLFDSYSARDFYRKLRNKSETFTHKPNLTIKLEKIR